MAPLRIVYEYTCTVASVLDTEFIYYKTLYNKAITTVAFCMPDISYTTFHGTKFNSQH